VMLLHARGHLDVDAPIGEYLSDYEVGRHGQPTVRHLLTHTAGLANPIPIRWVRPDGQPANRNLLASIIGRHGHPKHPPGTRAAYSNGGYLLAGRVIEAATGACVEQAITDLVLRPLHMDRTGFTTQTGQPRATGYVRMPRLAEPALKAILPSGIAGPRVEGYMSLRPFLVEGAAYGGLIGPACDAVKLAAAHLPTAPNGTFSCGPLGDLSDMTRIRHKGHPFDHGTGWFRKPGDAHRIPAFVEHYGTGGGFWNVMRIYPSLDIAAVAMTNATSRWPFDDFFTHIVDTVTHAGES
jgi:CubicO group peptidase (beta-lactamase class C family)